MRIAFFTDTYYPQVNGVSTSVLMLKEYLEKLGHEVYVFTTTDPQAPKGEKNVYRVTSIPFSSARRIGAFYNWRLGRITKHLGLDIIHTHTEFSLGVFGRLMARTLHLPLVHTLHTIYEDYTHYVVKVEGLDPIAKAAARKISANFCNVAAKVVVPSHKVRELLSDYGVCRDISVIPTGIKLDKFYKEYSKQYLTSLRAQLGIQPEDKVLANIGRISEEKNLDEIITAMAEYLPTRPNVKLLLVGNGPERKNLQAMASSLGIESQVVFAGERPWDEIAAYYKLGDVFVSASQSETQGLTYNEALAAGLPVIARADGCLDGVLETGVNGYTFTNKQELLAALDKVLQDDNHRSKLSQGAIASSQKFSAEHFAASMQDLYQSVLEKTHANSIKAS